MNSLRDPERPTGLWRSEVWINNVWNKRRYSSGGMIDSFIPDWRNDAPERTVYIGLGNDLAPIRRQIIA